MCCVIAVMLSVISRKLGTTFISIHCFKGLYIKYGLNSYLSLQVTVEEARDQCKLPWMCEALDKFEGYILRSRDVSNSSSEFTSDSLSQFSDEHSQQCIENSECEEMDSRCVDVVSYDERPISPIEDIPHLIEESASSSSDE